LPGGRPKRFAWRTVKPEEKSKGSNGRSAEKTAPEKNGDSGGERLVVTRQTAVEEKAQK